MTRRVMLGCAALSPYLLEKRTLRRSPTDTRDTKISCPLIPLHPRSKRRATRRLRARWRLTLKGPLALPALFVGSIVESSILPWPIEFPMLAYMLRGRIETLVVTLVVTLGSVVGCFLSYAAGRAAFGLMADFIAARPALADALVQAQAQINEAGAVAVSAAMMTPTPVQITSFAAGVLQMSPLSIRTRRLRGTVDPLLVHGPAGVLFGRADHAGVAQNPGGLAPSGPDRRGDGLCRRLRLDADLRCSAPKSGSSSGLSQSRTR
jgi:membrane protein YqaA with SNARE-associated domain